jgi:predicted N-acetyltransferase YhbS
MPDESTLACNVIVGTSENSTSASHIADMVNGARGNTSCSEEEIRVRLEKGDAQDANRVLHLALNADGAIVGCVSSSLTTLWTPTGCGHWGFLAVARSAQGCGVASTLVRAAEKRLSTAGLQQVQIECARRRRDPRLGMRNPPALRRPRGDLLATYTYTDDWSASHAPSQRLCDWYEGRLGFQRHSSWLSARVVGMLIGHHKKSEWRSCRKTLETQDCGPKPSTAEPNEQLI